MKKIIGLILFGLLIVGLFYPKQKIRKNKKNSITNQNKDNIYSLREANIKKESKEKNITKKVNKKLNISIYGRRLCTIGEEITIHNNVENNKTLSYTWKEGKKILGSSSNLLISFDDIGEHNITLIVIDNNGREGKDSIFIHILPPYDKKVFRRHRECGCTYVTYTYYNENGNISKTVTDSNNLGIEIEEFTYEDGKISSKHYINYYEDNRIFQDTITYYDKLGNIIKEYGKDYDYEIDKLVYINRENIYDKNSNLIKTSYIKDEYKNIAYYTYNEQGVEVSKISEEYQDDILISIEEGQSYFDKQGHIIKELKKLTDENGIEIITNLKEYKYDSNGNLILEKFQEDFDNDGKIDNEGFTIYDGFGKKIEEQYNNNHYYYTYNEQNKLIKEINKDSILLYKYDKQNRLIKEELISPHENTTTTYAYDTNNNTIYTKIQLNGEENSYEEVKHWKYNNKNKIVFYELKRDDEVIEYHLYNERGDILEYKDPYVFTKYIYDEDTYKLKSKISDRGRVDYFYSEDGELIKELDENGTLLYNVDDKR